MCSWVFLIFFFSYFLSFSSSFSSSYVVCWLVLSTGPSCLSPPSFSISCCHLPVPYLEQMYSILSSTSRLFHWPSFFKISFHMCVCWYKNHASLLLAQCSLFCSWPPQIYSVCQSVYQCVSSTVHIVFVLISMDYDWFYRYSYSKDSVMSVLPLGSAPVLTVLEIVVWHHLGTQIVTRGATSSCCTLQTWAIPRTLICS